MTEDNTYTTGELADACGTTVRTVQYYDQKGLLVPSGYSEGGRRMYADGDTERLRFILMLKTLGLKLSQIRGILESPNRGAILETLLEERASQLKDEIARSTTMLDGIVAPLLNFMACFGEEWGWRGYLLPHLSERHGMRIAVPASGVIWGLWHAPITVLGHNYGLDYPGWPLLGILAMCCLCVALSYLFS